MNAENRPTRNPPLATLRAVLGDRKLVLASSSPRRRALLHLTGLPFIVDAPDHPETPAPDHAPAEACIALAEAKAERVAPRHPHALVVAADTMVVLDGHLLGKPDNSGHATAMLTSLSGRSHEVVTGFCLLLPSEQRSISGVERTEVTFLKLDPADIDAYVATGAPLDKAGGYGIQDAGALFVSRIVGCFYNVVGFPLARFHKTCIEFLRPASPPRADR